MDPTTQACPDILFPLLTLLVTSVLTLQVIRNNFMHQLHFFKAEQRVESERRTAGYIYWLDLITTSELLVIMAVFMRACWLLKGAGIDFYLVAATGMILGVFWFWFFIVTVWWRRWSTRAKPPPQLRLVLFLESGGSEKTAGG